ncbi:MAG: anthranilate synthase component I [Thermoproteota archaeon]
MFGSLKTIEEERLTVPGLKIKDISVDSSPTKFFLKIHEKYENAFLLESMKGPKKFAQFSFIGFKPRLLIKAKEEKVKITNEGGGEFEIESDDPLSTIENLLGPESPCDRFRFVGGAVGYIAYDSIRYWEDLPNLAVDDQGLPDIYMGIYDDGVIYDHLQGETFYFYRSEDRAGEIEELKKENFDPGSLSFTTPRVNISKKRYEELVRKVKGYIASGDIFQVVLSKRYDFKVEGDITNFYLTLRRINPSPYMYFLKMGDTRIIGSSPEMLVRVDRDRVETFPIAGTRPRGDNQTENEALAQNLLSDHKERAEHVMLVDLARNDIGRVSRFGTIHVPEFMEVHQYSHVQHIVSRVVGQLREDCNCYDALRSVFPAGTVSGAPKVRAMEIIEESELTRRGPYAGAVGYFSYNGNSDFAITIRTLVGDGDQCYIQAGGGIVADSEPEREWYETEDKAKALMNALELSGENGE